MHSSSNAGSRSGYAGSFLQSSYAGRTRKQAEINLVPMIDIFTVLVTFLLMTAVFSRITILQLDLPSSAAPATPAPPSFRLEVIVRKDGFELTNGKDVIAAVPKADGAYDLKKLSELALALKQDHPDVDDASVLMEADIEYDYLVQVMDAIRSTEVSPSADGDAAQAAGASPPAAGLKPRKVNLFSHVAVGDAP